MHACTPHRFASHLRTPGFLLVLSARRNISQHFNSPAKHGQQRLFAREIQILLANCLTRFWQMANIEALISIFWNFSPGHGSGSLNSNICILPNMTQGQQFAASAIFIVVFIAVLAAVTCRSVWRVSQFILRPLFTFFNLFPYARFDIQKAILECSNQKPFDRLRLSQMHEISHSGGIAQPPPSDETAFAPLRKSYSAEASSFSGRAGAAWLVLLISLYNSALIVTVKSITCLYLKDFEPTFGSGELVWYYDGDLKCYTPWQIGCFFVLILLLMLPVGLYIGASQMIRNDAVKAASFSDWRHGALQYYAAAFHKTGVAVHWMTVMFMQRSLMMILTLIPFSPQSQCVVALGCLTPCNLFILHLMQVHRRLAHGHLRLLLCHSRPQRPPLSRALHAASLLRCNNIAPDTVCLRAYPVRSLQRRPCCRSKHRLSTRSSHSNTVHFCAAALSSYLPVVDQASADAGALQCCVRHYIERAAFSSRKHARLHCIVRPRSAQVWCSVSALPLGYASEN